MKNYTTRPILILLVLLLVVLGAYLFRSIYPENDKGRSDEELLQVITTEFPNFSPEGKPVIKIESVSRYDKDWYVVTIKSTEQINTFVPVKIVLRDQEDAGGLSVLLGPDVHFSKYQTLLYDLPDSVIIDLEEQ